MNEHETLDDAEARYAALALACDQAVLVCVSERIAFANDAAIGLLGASQREHIVGAEAARFFGPVAQPADRDAPAHAPIEIRRLDGSVLNMEAARLACRYGGEPAIQIIVRDTADRRRLERQVEFLSRHDILTEMPNRTEFRSRLAGAMARAHRDARQVAVMQLNLDRFNAINSKFGHEIGDQVLQSVALRLQQSIRKSDSAARTGGDEFALILEGLEQREQAAVVANRVLTSVKVPIEVEHFSGIVTASAGIAACPNDTQDIDALLRMSDIAMYAAKDGGRATFRFYFPELEALSHRDQARREQTVARMARLTGREREVMDVLVEGKSNKAIAYLLGASPRTIENHRARVMEKMEADSLPDLVRMVLEAKRG